MQLEGAEEGERPLVVRQIIAVYHLLGRPRKERRAPRSPVYGLEDAARDEAEGGDARWETACAMSTVSERAAEKGRREIKAASAANERAPSLSRAQPHLYARAAGDRRQVERPGDASGGCMTIAKGYIHLLRKGRRLYEL